MNKIIPVLAIIVLLGACKRMETVISEKNPPPSAAPPAPVAPPAPEATPLSIIADKQTMADALVVASPHMSDAYNEPSDGTVLFTLWANERLRWTDVAVTKDETSFGKISKDMDAERNKRLCVRGNIIQIQAGKTTVGKVFVGIMESWAGNLFHFWAVHSTNEVEEGRVARFCAVVMGWFDYDNKLHARQRAVELVGMFDIPENRAPK